MAQVLRPKQKGLTVLNMTQVINSSSTVILSDCVRSTIRYKVQGAVSKCYTQ